MIVGYKSEFVEMTRSLREGFEAQLRTALSRFKLNEESLTSEVLRLKRMNELLETENKSTKSKYDRLVLLY